MQTRLNTGDHEVIVETRPEVETPFQLEPSSLLHQVLSLILPA